MNDWRAVPMPRGMARLPVNAVGYPVPWFVAWIDGTPDFRVIGPGKMRDALRFGSCWLCGEHIGRWASFVIGPMCAVNRVSAEPPSHEACAVYAARACPFLSNPSMVRRERGIPEQAVKPAGEMITRNPGVTLVWTTRKWSAFAAPGGVLCNIGDPARVQWYCEGRDATRDEVVASIESGLPLLAEAAEQDGPRAVALLRRMTGDALGLVPA